jgi:hypothetical protein
LRLLPHSAIVVAGAVVPAAIQHQNQIKLRQENQTLRQQLDQLSKLREENDRPSNLVAQASNSKLQASEQFSELLGLRAEVGQLRQQTIELATLQKEYQQIHNQMTP